MAQVPFGGGGGFNFGNLLGGIGSAISSPFGIAMGLGGLSSFLQGSSNRDLMKSIRNDNRMAAFGNLLGMQAGMDRSRARDAMSFSTNVLNATTPFSLSTVTSANNLRTGLLQSGIGGAQQAGQQMRMAEFEQLLRGSEKEKSNIAKMKRAENRENLRDMQARIQLAAGVPLQIGRAHV